MAALLLRAGAQRTFSTPPLRSSSRLALVPRTHFLHGVSWGVGHLFRAGFFCLGVSGGALPSGLVGIF